MSSSRFFTFLSILGRGNMRICRGVKERGLELGLDKSSSILSSKTKHDKVVLTVFPAAFSIELVAARRGIKIQHSDITHFVLPAIARALNYFFYYFSHFILPSSKDHRVVHIIPPLL